MGERVSSCITWSSEEHRKPTGARRQTEQATELNRTASKERCITQNIRIAAPDRTEWKKKKKKKGGEG
jgi:hypothetical protein